MGTKRVRRGPRDMAAGPLKPHVDSFVLTLRAAGRSERTATMYSEAVRWFAAEHLLTGGRPSDIDVRYDTVTDTSADMVTFEPVRDWELVARVHIRSWLVRLRRRGHKDSYLNNQFRCLQQFFKWLAEEEEIPNPMRKLKPPTVVPEPVPVFEKDATKRILEMPGTRGARGKACNVRDTAIIMLLRDTGMRRQELAGLTVDDVSVSDRRALVTGKGGKRRFVKFTFETAKALDRYLRQRAKHSHAHLPHLWLSQKGGALSASGIYQMVRRRAERAGVEGAYLHRYRHDFSHRYLDNGGSEGDLMELNGWDSRQMLRRYGRSAAASRAQRSYDRIMCGAA
ncbi:tyrosine-type recombinase/integrase [Nocardiopsis sp. NPDC050513]|uniref:tyrosine-type recombinase/integrase n=1 Tax=Nocardiopsis sp. NPDC050513 TaxID=3364338 RepID=UPI0037B1F6C6